LGPKLLSRIAPARPGNIRYRVVPVIPGELAAEFVDGAAYGVLEVEPLL
jgi:hypothetical protein